MSLNNTTAKLEWFIQEEALWLDSIVQAYVPKAVKSLKTRVSIGRQHIGKRMVHWSIDYLFIARWLGIRIVRNRNTEVLGGKGFRDGIIKQRLNSITTRVFKNKVEVASKVFPLNITNNS